MDELIRREVVCLGVEFQVAGKYTSFMAIEKKDKRILEELKEDFEFLDEEIDKLTLIDSMPVTEVDIATSYQTSRARKSKASVPAASFASFASTTLGGAMRGRFGGGGVSRSAMASMSMSPPAPSGATMAFQAR
jgi:hypothetical protein